MNLRQSMLYGLKDSLHRLITRQTAAATLRPGEFWALKDVSFELGRGESLGIMGVNGSGKTTLLRILTGVFLPDAGEVSLQGRVGSLIAAGAGFAPMLTGRENIYVNGSLMGMTKQEIDDRLEAILEFSGVGAFVDSPVKHYSSGMLVRLGFAVAAMSEPDILLVDEVLAVGDLNFQKKCYDYLHRLKANGTSIILVSHSVGAIWAICDKGLFLHQGEVKLSGSVENVIRAYDDQNAALVQPASQPHDPHAGGVDQLSRPASPGPMGGTGDARVGTVRVCSLAGGDAARDVLEFHESFALEADLEVLTTLDEPIFRFTIDAAHYRFIVSVDSYEQNFRLNELKPGRYCLRVEIPDQNLMPGAYTVNVNVCRKGFGNHLFLWNGAASFQVKTPQNRLLYSEPNAVMFLEAKFQLR
jgi:lipopolysaccharide transport system ATP-binding protein